MLFIIQKKWIAALPVLILPGYVLISANSGHAQSARKPSAPFIVQDTRNDSPGTNAVSRVVTFTAEVGGTPPVALQWKVDKGGGFVAIPGATNWTFWIGDALVSDSGFYSLFASNSVGSIHTTPQRLIVMELPD